MTCQIVDVQFKILVNWFCFNFISSLNTLFTSNPISLFLSLSLSLTSLFLYIFVFFISHFPLEKAMQHRHGKKVRLKLFSYLGSIHDDFSHGLVFDHGGQLSREHCDAALGLADWIIDYKSLVYCAFSINLSFCNRWLQQVVCIIWP